MGTLIDRDALVERLKKSHEYHARNSREEALLCRDIRIVNESPTIDAEPVKRGQWVGSADGADEKPHWKYCPHCGAKIDEGGSQ